MIDRRVAAAIREAYERASLPVLTVFLFHDRRFHPSYGLTWRRKLRLARQMHRTCRAVPTGTSPRAHMAMAAKVFEVPPSVRGAIVEAGVLEGRDDGQPFACSSRNMATSSWPRRGWAAPPTTPDGLRRTERDGRQILDLGAREAYPARNFRSSACSGPRASERGLPRRHVDP